MIVGGICDSGVSWPRGLASSLPVIGIIMGIINQLHIFLNSPSPIAEPKASLRAVRQAAQNPLNQYNAEASPSGPITPAFERERMNQAHAVSEKALEWIASPQQATLCAAYTKENFYSKAALLSHFLTLSVIVALVATHVLSEHALALGLISLPGIFLHGKAYFHSRLTLENIMQGVCPVVVGP